MTAKPTTCRYCEYVLYQDEFGDIDWKDARLHVYHEHPEEWRRAVSQRREMDWYVHLAKGKPSP